MNSECLKEIIKSELIFTELEYDDIESVTEKIVNKIMDKING